MAARHRRLPGGRVHPAGVPRSRGRAMARPSVRAGPTGCWGCSSATSRSAWLRLVGRQAPPPPRAPQHGGARPRHPRRRRGVHRRRRRAAARVAPVHRPPPGASCSSRCCCWRRCTCTSRASGRRRAPAPHRCPGVAAARAPRRRLLTVVVAGAVPLRRWRSSRCSRRCSGSTWAARSRPTTRACRSRAPDDRLDFLRRQVLTSRNVRGGRFTDFALGGLNYQIEHHLFPSMPRPACAAPSRSSALTAPRSACRTSRPGCSSHTGSP